MARSLSRLVLGLLVVCCVVQFRGVAATQPDSDETYATTDPITFKFSDEAATTAASPTEEETASGEILWQSEPSPVVDDEADPTLAVTFNGDDLPSAAGPAEEDPDSVVFTTEEGGNGTFADDDEFDMVERDDDTSLAMDSSDAEVGDLSLSSSGCGTGNPVDDCWRCDPNWAAHRQNLAKCAIGFGRNAIGGMRGRIYVVTSARDDNPANPAPGTLRYAVTRPGPLWITFAYSMTIKLKNELMISSFKTIDGRGASVKIVGGAGLTMQRVSNVIIHGISISDIKPTGPGRIMTDTSHVGNRGRTDGDAISIFASHDIWVDHCYLARAADGLLDVIRGSTAVSVTNTYFTQHDKVMLLGAHKDDTIDRGMRVTVAYNIFGPGLVQRMPRVRFGKVHVLNNDYTSGWSNYALGGSEGPTILSQGNVFNAGRGKKQVTQRIDDGGPTMGGSGNWNWRSEGDQFLAGSFWSKMAMRWSSQSYAATVSASARPASMVVRMVKGAGPLACRKGARCY